MANNLKRILAMLLAMTMCMGMLATTALAEGELICDKQEHTHTEECYKTLTCGQEESAGHAHTDACYTLTCELTEGEGGHTHTEACYTISEDPVCGLEEHTHTEECYAQEPEDDQQDDENTLVVTGTDKNGNPVTYTGPVIPAEPEESDASVYETEEAVNAALEAAEAALQEAEEAYARWDANFSDAWDNCGLFSDTTKQVSSIFTQASDCKKAWESWVDALTERRNELLSGGCICGDHQYACEEGAIDENCPVCTKYPELCKGPQPVKSGTYWQFYYNKESKKGTLRITGDHTLAYPSKGWWPWDSGSYIPEISGQIYNKVTDVVVEDNVTKLGDYMFAQLSNVETITIGSGVTEWGESLFGGQNIETVTVNSPTFDSVALTGGGYQGTYHIDTLILDNPEMEIADNGNDGGLINVRPIQVENLVLINVKTVGSYAFIPRSGGITTLTIGNVGEIGECAFMESYNLTTITFTEGASLGSIGASAFELCTELSGEIVIPDSCTYVGDFAFQDCDKITNLTIPATTQLGYSNIFVKFPDLVARMEAILAGQFALNETSSLDSLTVPAGWESSHLGEDNGTGSGDTQVTKAARWTNEDKTQAEVEFQFNYDKPQGMDFIFVVDYSGSMAAVGNLEADSDSKFTSMQSKLLDVADELLNTPGYDNRVAVVSFSSHLNGFLDFTKDDGAVADFVLNDDPYGSTNYTEALEKAEELIQGRGDKSREAAVIFISDGRPNISAYGATTAAELLEEIAAVGDRIKAQGIDVFGVMQSVPDSEMDRCVKAMQSVCTEGLFFLASDTQEFSDAINNAISAAYNIYTLTDVIGDDFDLVENSIRVSTGQAAYDADTRTITWTIYGVPYTTYTMHYDLTLKPVDGSYPYGSFDTNKGDAAIALSADRVNAVATPVLAREETSSGGGGGIIYTYYDVTVNYYDEEGNAIAPSHTENIREGLRYDVTAYDAIAIEGYTYVETTGDALTGTVNGNKTINVYYTAETELDDGDTPLDPGPGEDPDIPDGDIPLDPAPGGDEGVDIVDPDTPMGNLPQTGTAEAVTPYMTAGLMALAAAMTMAGLYFSRKRGKHEEL